MNLPKRSHFSPPATRREVARELKTAGLRNARREVARELRTGFSPALEGGGEGVGGKKGG